MAHTVECLACGHVGQTKKKGSTLVLILLLIFLFPIGILYWLLTRSSSGVCSACNSQNVRLYVPKPTAIQPIAAPQPQEPRFNKTKLVSNDGLAYNSGHITQLDNNGVEQKNCKFCKELIRFDAIKCKHCGSMLDG